ncbi:hypothetical protein H8S90_22425 [Olivibacter sp. SDN3]|uniref:hypothetical protein n=1 Tax=Olivibacter sp. SDN3 TaxID=2764720 RepID=UPI00165156EC|nr:hypothetical protein [Olivibacter sp. SDN3]QNL49452.1 hypothetical protein H8S90_22425 [Olivibacter sp. SDN3]
MKRLNYSWLVLIFITCLCTCQKQTYTLPEALDKSQITFEVVQDLATDAGGNTVILINNTAETISYWDYGTGQSNRQRDTVQFAFKGTYEIKFAALTGGGLVEMDPITIEVTEDNLNYVNDPLWIALSGGPGEEKTWILDIDNHFFEGPLYFYGTDNGWLEEGDDGCYGDDCWNWSPDYAGNSWLMPYGDYGTMTFSLKDGPYITVEHLMLPNRGTEQGTYNLNIQDKTLSLSGASPLHDNEREGCVANWGDIKLMSLTENTMQLAVLRRASCEGEALLVYNYVSKDFADSENDSE